MKVRLFVSGTAVALAAWLGVTYVQTVPVQHYPQLGRGSLPISAKRERANHDDRAAESTPETVRTIARAGE